MEIIGKSIPHLQTAISSGFDNVTAGIAETVRAAGVSALDSTFELFSASKMGIASDANLLPAVANVAEYSDPITALSRQSNSSSQAASSSALPLLQTMQNPKFAPEAELSTFTEAKVNETFKNLGKELPYKAESESAQGRDILRNDSLLSPFGDFEAKKQKELEDKMKELEARSEAEKWKQLKESLGQVDQLPYVSAAEGDLGVIPQGLMNGSDSASPQIDAGSTAVADIGTASSNTLESRGIIIVGGKTDGTYFQTVDDTINKFQNDPQPETLNLLQNQANALQDMATTSMETVRFYQQYSDSLIGIRR